MKKEERKLIILKHCHPKRLRWGCTRFIHQALQWGFSYVVTHLSRFVHWVSNTPVTRQPRALISTNRYRFELCFNHGRRRPFFLPCYQYQYPLVQLLPLVCLKNFEVSPHQCVGKRAPHRKGHINCGANSLLLPAIFDLFHDVAPQKHS